MPAWTLHVFNNLLYVTTGDRNAPVGYGVYKTGGVAPTTWQPVITGGAHQTGNLLSPDALSAQEFNGALYVGTDRPTEMIRIHPDDTWDLIIGAPRRHADGHEDTVEQAQRTGAGNVFNGHFWNMAVHDGSLYMGTWDWSIGLRALPMADPLFRYEYGFDLFRSERWRHLERDLQGGYGQLLRVWCEDVRIDADWPVHRHGESVATASTCGATPRHSTWTRRWGCRGRYSGDSIGSG